MKGNAKTIRSPSSILQVARLYRPTVEGVKKEVLELARATPSFNYSDLQKIIFHLLRGFATYDQATGAIRSIGYQLKRDSYLRAFDPAWTYLKSLRHTYALPIDTRFFAISRDMRIPCIPPMVCGTPSGQVVPWLMYWKKNVLKEEQMALFLSMALEVMENDAELDEARLVVVDTSDAALDPRGMPKTIDCHGLSRLNRGSLAKMLDTFVQGFNLAVAEWNQSRPVQKERKQEIESTSQPLLFRLDEIN